MILPASWSALLESFRPVFRRRGTFTLFTVLATGLVLQTGRRSVVGMLAGAGMASKVSFHAACRFFSSAVWDIDALCLVAARLIVARPLEHDARLRLPDSVPLAVLENFLPSEFTAISGEELQDHGLYRLLRARRTLIRVADQRIGARAATAEESRLLGTKPRGPVLTMDRTAYDDAGRAVESGHHCCRPDLYSFEMTLVDG